jgi:hypothetical protein
MRHVYEQTALLFMPSQVEEAFGRVIVEAAANGIPVVASDIGGIPEALADGGVLIPHTDPAERWAEAIERILSDSTLYARLSSSAYRNANDAMYDPGQAISRNGRRSQSSRPPTLERKWDWPSLRTWSVCVPRRRSDPVTDRIRKEFVPD